MIKLSKETPESVDVLVFDVRDKVIAKERNLPWKVFLGKISPNGKGFKWESAWGGNQGEAPTVERCQYWIEVCAKGMYK